MVVSTRKRVFIIICIFGGVCLLIRFFLYNGGELLNSSPSYRRSADAPVLVMVFYEALCVDSKHFILKQLIPAYEEASPLMEVQLIPYGKAETIPNEDGTYRFDCQHGPVECQANIYHSCAIEAIADVKTRLNVIACMIKDNRLPKEAMQRCTKQHNVENTDLIQKCFDSNHGAELLKINGDATHSLRPPIHFIPTITLDGTQGRQAAILKNLLAEVCKIFGDNPQSEQFCNVN